MVTHKTFPNHRVFETQIGNRTFTVETGKVAELANAECICRYGDTVVLTTVTASPDPKPGIDYFPLTIEFEERLYSVGRIPGSFNRREGKPSERGILNSRLIDRPMRPLFDEELRNDVVVTCTVLANDYDNPVEIVASLGASISIASSDVPWNGPVATTNVAYVNGEYVVNPSAEERAAASCFVTIASTFEKVVMIETEANESPESIVLECIRIAHETNMEIVKFINGIVAEIGKPKFTFEKAAVNHDLLDELCAYGMDQIEYALDTDDKNIREERWNKLIDHWHELFLEEYPEMDKYLEEMEVYLDNYYNGDYKAGVADTAKIEQDFRARIKRFKDKRFKNETQIQKGLKDELTRIENYRKALVDFNGYLEDGYVELTETTLYLQNSSTGETLTLTGKYSINLCPDERMKNLKNDVYYYKTVKDENDEEKTVPTAEDINIVLLDFHNDKYAYSRWEGLCFVNYLIRTSLAAE